LNSTAHLTDRSGPLSPEFSLVEQKNDTLNLC
jgi:hypothetical protein